MFGFKCTECGICCTNFSNERIVIIFPKDITNISKRLVISEKEFIKKYCIEKIVNHESLEIKILILNNTGRCVFLTQDDLCSIHEFKPYQCSQTPFNFLWNKNNVDFPCLEEIKVPSNWTSEDFDEEIFKTIFEEK